IVEKIIQANMKLLRSEAAELIDCRRVAGWSFILPLLLFTLAIPSVAQKNANPSRKLPSAEKITGNYFKAIGGKKLIAATKDANYEWHLESKDDKGTARTQIKLPASQRTELTFTNGQIISATNASSAWEIDRDGRMRTLTGPEAAVTKLRGVLNASRLFNYK